jgi:CubicO group peptidase (beta-lactamase class C family)
MTLVEEGKISLDDRVSRWLPSFAKTAVIPVGATEPVPARRQITIRDLLTHTAGISYGTDARVAELYRDKQLGPAAGWGWYTADKSEPVCTTMDRLGTLPFVAQPGTAFVYGYNTDILGCVVERVSGQSLDAFFRSRITGPLGMRDTHFFVPDEKRSRFVAVYMNDSTGKSVRAPDGPRGQGDYVTGPRTSFSGGAGLVSTARDYARLLQMLLRGGELDGARILAPRTVALMSSNQSGTLYSTDGRGFGLGFSTVDRLGADGFRSVGAFGWGGAYGSNYTVDPQERLVIVFMINQLPNSSDVPSKFVTMVYQALMSAK